MQWPMVSIVTKENLSHIWISQRSCLSNLAFKNQTTFTGICNLNDSVSTCYLENVFLWHALRTHGRALFMEHSFKRGKGKSVLHSLTLLPCDVTVARRCHRPGSVLRVQEEQAAPQMLQSASNHALEHCTTSRDLAAIMCYKNRCWSFLLHITTAHSVIQKHGKVCQCHRLVDSQLRHTRNHFLRIYPQTKIRSGKGV